MLVWLLKLPASLYVEDVKALAKEGGLRIIDESHASHFSEDEIELKPPKVTLANKPKKTRAKKQS